MSPPQYISSQSQYLYQEMIGMLSDKVLLNIFRYYLDAFPRFWPTLIHICRKWRHIVFTSQQALNIRLFCSSGTPVSKALHCWPGLPIVMEYGGSLGLDYPTLEDEYNIIAALKQSNRVSSISLTVTTSLQYMLYAVKRPLLELEDLTLLSQDNMLRTLPSTFLWGPHLRRLHLTSIDIPSLLQLLYSSRNLEDLHLHNALDPHYFPIEELADALSGLAQLQSLSLYFISTTRYHLTQDLTPLLRDQLIVLPALTHLNLRGTASQLEPLVDRIDGPRLGDIQVTLIDGSILNPSKLGEFIDRIEIRNSLRQARILSSERAISISLTQPGVPTCFDLRSVDESISNQLYAMSKHILPSFSALLPNVEDLRISATQVSRSFNDEQWLDVLYLFPCVKWLHLDLNSTKIVHALQGIHWRTKTTVLPTLYKLYLPQPRSRHAPLSEALGSFITSRWRSGCPIWVEYERSCCRNDSRGTGPISKAVTIDYEMLSDDILLNIFQRYLDATPQHWPILTYVCRRWRQVISSSPAGLRLRIYCTHGTPVSKILEYSPPFPFIINYGGPPMLSPPAPEDDDNIIAVLQQSDRVNSISLTLTTTLLGKLSTVSEPFSELEELVLLSQDNLQLTLPSAFRWGPRLRTLHVTRITIPSLPPLLSSSTDLVDLQLHEIPIAGYFSPHWQAFADALSGASHLRSLSLHFLSCPPRRSYVGLPSSSHRIVLPALTCFKYRGTSKYLDIFVARIDAPHLGDIDVIFFNQPTMDASQLGKLIRRIDIQTLLTEAHIQTSAHAISIFIKNSNTPIRVRLQISCQQLDWQLSSMAQVCGQFSWLRSRVNDLTINTNELANECPSGRHEGKQWLQLFRSFSGARTLSLVGGLTTHILCALGPAGEEGGREGTIDRPVLPALDNLHLRRPMPIHRLDAAQTFIRSRHDVIELSCHPSDSELQVQCPRCRTGISFTQGQIREHLATQHASEMVCSYCQGLGKAFNIQHISQFQDHLRTQHSTVTYHNHLISQHILTLTDLDINTLFEMHASTQSVSFKQEPG